MLMAAADEPTTPAPTLSVPPAVDYWHWRVRYRDGAQLNEYAADAADASAEQGTVDHGWADVDHARARALELLPQRPGYPPLVVRLDDDDHAGRLLCFHLRKVRVHQGAGGDAGDTPATLTLAARENLTVAGRVGADDVVTLYWCREDGSIVRSYGQAADGTDIAPPWLTS